MQQPKVSYTHGIIVNIYIVYELSASSSHSDDPTPKNCLFDSVTLTKNADIDSYRYSGYGIEFDRKSSFSFPSSGFDQNVIIFEVDMSSSAHVDLNAEKMHSINFTVTKKKFCFSLHYKGANSYLFVNGTEIYKFKAFRDCCSHIMSRKHFKRLVNR